MATKKKNVKQSEPVKRKAGRPAASAGANVDKVKGKPVVIFMAKKLHARVRLGCMALGTTVSDKGRELFELWIRDKKTAKAIQDVVNIDADDDEDEVEEDEVEDTEDAEDEDEEEAEEDEEEEDEDEEE